MLLSRIGKDVKLPAIAVVKIKNRKKINLEANQK